MDWWMNIGPAYGGPNSSGMCRVDYNVPGSTAGPFSIEVDEDTARLLLRAKEAGREEARKEIRRALGLS